MSSMLILSHLYVTSEQNHNKTSRLQGMQSTYCYILAALLPGKCKLISACNFNFSSTQSQGVLCVILLPSPLVLPSLWFLSFFFFLPCFSCCTVSIFYAMTMALASPLLVVYKSFEISCCTTCNT